PDIGAAAGRKPAIDMDFVLRELLRRGGDTPRQEQGEGREAERSAHVCEKPFGSSWPGSSRPSRLGRHSRALLVGIAGTSAAMTAESGANWLGYALGWRAAHVSAITFLFAFSSADSARPNPCSDRSNKIPSGSQPRCSANGRVDGLFFGSSTPN